MVNHRSVCLGTAVVAALVGWYGVAAAVDEPSAEDRQLTTAGQAVDQRAAAKPDGARIAALSNEFHVQPSEVERLRTSGQGWGETTIELALAQQLTKNDPATYPTMTAALQKVESVHQTQPGWGQVAHELGLKVGPVISEVKRTGHAMQTAVATPAAQPARPSRGEGVGPSSERPERPARPEHAMHEGGSHRSS